MGPYTGQVVATGLAALVAACLAWRLRRVARTARARACKSRAEVARNEGYLKRLMPLMLLADQVVAQQKRVAGAIAAVREQDRKIRELREAIAAEESTESPDSELLQRMRRKYGFAIAARHDEEQELKRLEALLEETSAELESKRAQAQNDTLQHHHRSRVTN